MLSVANLSSPQVNSYKNLPADEKFKVKDVHHVKIESSGDLRIKAEISRLKKWENHVKQHELSHAMVGGSGVGSISYVYTYGPDGKRYIQGGQVSIKIPAGLSQKSFNQLKKLKQATGAPGDMSSKDMNAAAIISAIEKSRSNKLVMIEAVQKYEKSLQQKAQKNIASGNEIFIYKQMGNSSVGLIELFV